MNVSTLLDEEKKPEKRKPVLTGLTAKPTYGPVRLLVYGQSGVGKSTFASQAPAPIFVGSEDGTSELSVIRYPEPVTSGEDILAAVDTLIEEPHQFKTMVLDTVDWAEPLVWESVCREAGKEGKGIESLGFGKGYTAAQEFWLRILRRCEMLRHKRDMHVLLLGHSTIRTFHNPEGEDYDTYTIKMHEKSAGVIREWCDDVLFARQEKFAHKDKKDAKAKGVTSGERVLETVDAAAFFAKNRHRLPPTLPFQWDAYWQAVQDSRRPSADSVRSQIESMLSYPSTDDELRTKVRAAVAAACDDAVKLSAIAGRLNERLKSNGNV